MRPFVRHLSLIILSALVFFACTREENAYVYEMKDQVVKQAGANKSKPKTDLEFISVIYTDLYGRTIAQEELLTLANIYNSFGDKKVAVDMVLRNLINNPQAQIPDAATMRANPEKFIEDVYKKFYVRQPTEYEKWFFKDQITKDPALTPQQVYYAFLTSNEYKFY